MGSFYKEKIGTDSYICYDAGNDESVDQVACKMMDNNEIPGLLPMNYVTINGKTIFRYNITGLKSLEDYLSERFNGIQLLIYLKEIAHAASLLLPYMLEEEMLCCDKSLIFIDDRNHAKVVYLPFTEKTEGDSLTDLSRDIVELPYVRRYVNPNMYRELKRFIENDSVDSKEFTELLEKITLNAVVVSVQNGNAGEGPVVLDAIDRNRNTDSTEGVVLSERQRVKKVDEVDTSEKKATSDPVILSHKPISAIADDEDDAYSERTVRIPRTQYVNKIPDPDEEELSSYDDESTMKYSFDESMDEEGTIRMPVEKTAVLIRSNTQERLVIKPMIFRVGKSKYDNEYSIRDNPVISRHHAMIVKRENNYYIKDLDSKNKTYINGNRLIPQQEYELFDQAVIRMANEEFLFILE